ncbi:MAG: hypothetical protein JNM88_01755 [Chitinophagaceae bacterium]|nr:hypothetical protein [Chitinophagaceae bacterium]
MLNIEPVKTDLLNIDYKNPRLAEFNLGGANINEVYKLLWDEMALEEIVISITAHGFFQTEPLLVVVENKKKVVIEGNRRLSAVKIILDENLSRDILPDRISEKITRKLRKELETLPVLELKSREEAWRFIGFKHINGAAKWNSFAKAIYIADVHNKYKISLDDIAYQVGDTHNTVQKLYQGIMVIEQAEKLKVFDRTDIAKRRLYFSHLYTALQYEGFKEFLGISESDAELKAPVPIEKKTELGEVLTWLYGSKKKDIDPIIKSQNPDLRNLERVLSSKPAVAALRSGYTLEQAYEFSLPSATVFQENLLATKRYLQKAWANVTTGYDKSFDLLKTAGSIADIADKLYSEMEKIRNQESGNSKKPKRITED